LAQEKTSLSVVDDQFGSPTSVELLSKAIQIIIQYLDQKNNLDVFGTYHVTSDGVTNRYLCARKILGTLESFKVELRFKKYDLHPISSDQRSQNATRPKNSKLNTDKFKKIFKAEFSHWENEIDDTVLQMLK
jgi:dTDP-4-dehydrorhamnose reductase